MFRACIAAIVTAMVVGPAGVTAAEVRTATHSGQPDGLVVPEGVGGELMHSMAWVIAKGAAGERIGRTTGLAVAPDLLLVPLQAVVLADSLAARAACCDERPATGIIAFDAVAGLALVRVPELESAVWNQIAAVPDPLPEMVNLYWRPALEIEGNVMLASGRHGLLASLVGVGRGARLRIDHDVTMGVGDVITTDEGAIYALTTEWAGNDRVFAVPVADFLAEHLPIDRAAAFAPSELMDRVQGDTQRSALLTIRAQAMRATSPPPDLVPMLRDAVERAPDNAGAWYLLGVKLDESGSLTEGRESLERAVELEPGWSEPWYSLGLVQLKSDDPVAAEQSFRASLRLDDTHPDCQAMLGVALLMQGNPEAALGPMERACELEPERMQFVTNYAIALERAGGESQIHKAWTRYVEAVPSDRRAHNSYLSALFAADEYELLEAQAQRGLEQFGEHDMDLALQAIAGLSLGRDMDEMRALLERALELNPRNDIARSVLDSLP